MLRSFLLLLFVIGTFQVKAAAPMDTVVTKAYIESLEARIQRIETTARSEKLEATTRLDDLTNERLDLINEKIENLKSETDRSTDDMANLISSTSTGVTVFLGVWSLIFALAGIGLGAYINAQQNKAAKHLAESEVILGKSEKLLETQRSISDEVLRSEEAMKGIQLSVNEVKGEVNNTQELINNKLSELYHKLQLEEVDHLIKRLEKDPHDIDNIFSKLTTISLPERYFNKLSSIITGSCERVQRTKIELLIIQHFPILWLKDFKIKEDFIYDSTWFILSMFAHEVEEQLTALIEYYKEVEPDDLDYAVGAAFISYDANHFFDQYSKELVTVDFSLPENENHKRSIQERYKRFYVALPSKEQRFLLLYSALTATDNGKNSTWNLKLIYGYQLIRDYKGDITNTNQQNIIIELLEREP